MQLKENQGGRPTKFKKEFEKVAFQLALLGATDPQVADALDVSVDTIYQWKVKYKRFSEALKGGKLKADAKVAFGLYRKATGFHYNEVSYEKIGDEDILREDDSRLKIDLYKKRIVRKFVPPEAGAAMSWLKNRQKDLWREKQVIEFENMTDEQLDKIIEELKKTVYEERKNDD